MTQDDFESHPLYFDGETSSDAYTQEQKILFVIKILCESTPLGNVEWTEQKNLHGFRSHQGEFKWDKSFKNKWCINAHVELWNVNLIKFKESGRKVFKSTKSIIIMIEQTPYLRKKMMETLNEWERYHNAIKKSSNKLCMHYDECFIKHSNLLHEKKKAS